MAIRPFWFTDTVALGANSTGVAQISVSAGETIRLRRMQAVSTSTFNIQGLRDASGLPYSNASSGDPIPNTLLNDAAADSSGISKFEPPLEIVGPNTLNIDLLDTSGAANTVRIAFEGEKET